jgi:hypothetical protein
MSPFVALVKSRKFWITFIPWIVVAVGFVRGQVAAEQFIDATLVLVTFLVGAIAVEDAAAKLSGNYPGSGA